MDQRKFCIVAAAVFALVALVHLLRILMNWPIVIGTWSVPMWLSWIGLIVAGGLSVFGFRVAAR
jgi:hypothetical protein